jgi:hypothetical protein
MFEAPGMSAFTPRWADAPPRFAAWAGFSGSDGSDQAPLGDIAPAQEISLWDAGYAAGRAEALAEREVASAQSERLAHALARLQPMPPVEFAEALATQVRTLLRQLVGSASVDEALLSERCMALADLAHSSTTAELHVQPEDALLLAGDHGLTIISDPVLLRGEVRLIDGPAEFAAGPHTMLDSWGDDPC